jgi:hypothetical protein
MYIKEDEEVLGERFLGELIWVFFWIFGVRRRLIAKRGCWMLWKELWYDGFG